MNLASKFFFGSVPFAHVAIGHSYSQQPVPRGFPLWVFKRCELAGEQMQRGQTGATLTSSRKPHFSSGDTDLNRSYVRLNCNYGTKIRKEVTGKIPSNIILKAEQ